MKTMEEIKIGDTVFNRPVIKVTKKCVYIDPTVPWGKARFTKEEIKKHYQDMEKRTGRQYDFST